MATQPTDTAKPRVRTLGDELTVIAQRAQAFTNASGTAIALSEGNADEIICRARSGSAAPDVGAALRVEGSFTGLCIQSGKELRCDDAETDTRVDMAAIRALGIRSMVVTPVRHDSKVVGVLACFAPTAHAFTITHVAVLKTMADQIAVLLQKERRIREGGPKASASASAPEITVAQPASTERPAPPAVVIKPQPANATNGVSAPARGPFPVVSKVEPAAPVPLPRKEEKKPEVRASFGTFDAVAADSKKSVFNIKIVGIAVALVIAAGATFTFLKMHKTDTPVPAPQAQEAANPTQPATPQQGQQAQATTTAEPVPAGASEMSPSASVTAKPNIPNHAESKSVAAASSPARNRKSVSVAERTSATESPEKQQNPAPITVALSSGPSRIKAEASPQRNAVVAPTLSMMPGGTPGSLSALARPVSAAPKEAVTRSKLEPLKILKTVPPVYPPIARIRGMSGQVVVEVTVGKDGRAHSPKLVSGQPIFRDSAFEAVKQWRFKPAQLNGQPVEQTTQIKIGFHP